MSTLEEYSADELESELRKREAAGKDLPFVGEPVSRSHYEIKFIPVTGVFDNDDAVRDAINHSAWGEDNEFHGAGFERGESAVPPQTYPWICVCEQYVSKTSKGRCPDCGDMAWKKREMLPPLPSEAPAPVDWEAFRLCPTCGEKSVGTCRCPRSDSYCSKGHNWHMCVIHRRVVLGKSDHSLDTNTCTCGVGG